MQPAERSLRRIRGRHRILGKGREAGLLRELECNEGAPDDAEERTRRQFRPVLFPISGSCQVLLDN